MRSFLLLMLLMLSPATVLGNSDSDSNSDSFDNGGGLIVGDLCPSVSFNLALVIGKFVSGVPSVAALADSCATLLSVQPASVSVSVLTAFPNGGARSWSVEVREPYPNSLTR